MLLAFLLALQSTVPEKCALEGRVLRAGSGDPLNKVHLTLSPQGGRDARPRFSTTDDTGRFSFQDVDPGRYQLSAGRNGYVRQEYGQGGSSRAGTALALERGQSLRDIVIRLTPHAVIAGRVVDADGEPVSNVDIQLLRPGRVQALRLGRPGAGRRARPRIPAQYEEKGKPASLREGSQESVTMKLTPVGGGAR